MRCQYKVSNNPRNSKLQLAILLDVTQKFENFGTKNGNNGNETKIPQVPNMNVQSVCVREACIRIGTSESKSILTSKSIYKYYTILELPHTQISQCPHCEGILSIKNKSRRNKHTYSNGGSLILSGGGSCSSSSFLPNSGLPPPDPPNTIIGTMPPPSTTLNKSTCREEFAMFSLCGDHFQSRPQHS